MAGGIRWTLGKITLAFKKLQTPVTGLIAKWGQALKLKFFKLVESTISKWEQTLSLRTWTRAPLAGLIAKWEQTLGLKGWFQVPLSGLIAKWEKSLSIRQWIQAPIAGLIDKWEKALSIRLWIQAPLAGLIAKWERALAIRQRIQAPLSALIEKWEGSVIAVLSVGYAELLEGVIQRWERALSLRLWLQTPFSGMIEKWAGELTFTTTGVIVTAEVPAIGGHDSMEYEPPFEPQIIPVPIKIKDKTVFVPVNLSLAEKREMNKLDKAIKKKPPEKMNQQEFERWRLKKGAKRY